MSKVLKSTRQSDRKLQWETCLPGLTHSQCFSWSLKSLSFLKRKKKWYLTFFNWRFKNMLYRVKLSFFYPLAMRKNVLLLGGPWSPWRSIMVIHGVNRGSHVPPAEEPYLDPATPQRWRRASGEMSILAPRKLSLKKNQEETLSECFFLLK